LAANPRWMAVGLLFWGCSREVAPPPKAELAPKPAKILHFYASQGEIQKGERALICYGVEDALSVRMEPAVEELKPILNRCFAVSPAGTTEYKLIAQGADGGAVSASFTVKVTAGSRPVRGGGLIELFVASPAAVKPGQIVNLCYSVQGAETVRIEPDLGMPTSAGKQCVAVRPDRTTTYKLVARGAAGGTEQEQVTVKVQ